MAACSGARSFIPCCSDSMFQPLVASAGASSGRPKLTASHLQPPGSAQRHDLASWHRNIRNAGLVQDMLVIKNVTMNAKMIPHSRKSHQARVVVIQGPRK